MHYLYLPGFALLQTITYIAHSKLKAFTQDAFFILESDTRDFNISLQADLAFGNSKRFFFTGTSDQNRAQTLKVWLLRGGYMGGWSLSDQAGSYSEDMLFGEIHRRILLKRQVLFSQRIRMDNRWLGQVPEYSYRFRYRAMFEREFLSGKTSIIPFVSADPFWDSRYELFNRLRVIGVETTFCLRRKYYLPIRFKFILHQLLAFNAILHLYFETARVRENAGKK